MLKLMLAAALLVSAGCTGTIYKSAEELQTENTQAVAGTYGGLRQLGWPSDPSKFRAELERRNAFTPEEWARIDNREIAIGDSAELVAAAWGDPNSVRTLDTAGSNFSTWYYRGTTIQPHGVLTFQGRSLIAIER